MEIDNKSLEFVVAWSEFNDKCKSLDIDYRASVHLFGSERDKLFLESSQPIRASKAVLVDALDDGNVRVLEHDYRRYGVIGENHANIWHNMALSTLIEDGGKNIERYFEAIVETVIDCTKDKK